MPSKSIIMSSDSYKFSMFKQMPPNTTEVYSYIESRGGEWNATEFFGLQMFIKEYLTKPITQEDIDFAEPIILAHGEPFNREGWEYILNNHGGYLPVIIKAAPEGLIIPVQNVLCTIRNTDWRCAWLIAVLETALLRAIWYPTTVATNSYEYRKLLLEYLDRNGSPETIDFKFIDFGSRGVSSMESSGIGGAAHLVNFQVTDNITGLLYAHEYYNAGVSGFSVPASEHSTVTSWGKEGEVDSFRNMIKQFGKEGSIVSCVSDSYNIYAACEMWGTVLKQDVIDSGCTLVIRPDSGNPSEVVVRCLDILEKYYGSVMNDKGYKVLNVVKVLQGDGMDLGGLQSLLFCLDIAGYSADNLIVGAGGALLQQIDRDTMKFACKCSAALVDGKWVDVFKDPIGDSGKRSKKGRVTLTQSETGQYSTVVETPDTVSILKTVFENGNLITEYSFDEVRANSKR